MNKLERPPIEARSDASEVELENPNAGSDHVAVSIRNVNKTYRLHGSPGDQLVDLLGLQRFGLRTKTDVQTFEALKDITIDVTRGRRIGLLGRNGAGKSTLLKLISGNIAPTSGDVVVNGTVQALLSMGLGFHPEYTGRQNVEASLRYSGLSTSKYAEAMESIIDFCELDMYFDQQFKTYSAGMQARLMFAAATAVQPDILIVDEVLGAGDAYFIAKSKKRVEGLVSTGCTLILVSHSMQQILELCHEAIWLDKGAIRMRGDSFDVVKAYEEFMHGPIQQVLLPEQDDAPEEQDETDQGDAARAIRETQAEVERPPQTRVEHLLQEPCFLPHAATPAFPEIETPSEHKFPARGGLSRWNGVEGLKILGSTFVTEKGEANTVTSMQPLKFVMTVVGERDGDFKCRFAFVAFDHLGNVVIDVLSARKDVSIRKGERRRVEMLLNPLQLGPGEYTVSISVHDYDEIGVFNSTDRYDLLSRSLELKVELPDSLMPIASAFYHSAEWYLG